MKKMIEFKNVTLTYGKKEIFKALSFEIFEKDFLGIVGPNGSGKTTILRSIMGLIKPRGGVVIKSDEVRFGYCMQRQFIDTLFPFTVFETVLMARTSLIAPLKPPSREDRLEAEKALDVMGIISLKDISFHDLSGGQKQRVLLARSLATRPNFLVLDEPTTDLDIKMKREILELIKNFNVKEKMTVILVTHDLNEIINYAQDFMFLDGNIPQRIIRKNELNEQMLSEIFKSHIRLKELEGKKVIF